MPEQTLPMNHAVVCLTVLDELPTSAILEIGATAFPPHGADIGGFAYASSFYRAITLESNLRVDRTINEERFTRIVTDAISQRRWLAANKVVLGTALEALGKYFHENGVSRVWCQQGLAAWTLLCAYEKLRKHPPFDWRGIRETMTAFGLTAITRETWDKCVTNTTYNDPGELSWGLARALQHCMKDEDDDGPEGSTQSDARDGAVADGSSLKVIGTGTHGDATP